MHVHVTESATVDLGDGYGTDISAIEVNAEFTRVHLVAPAAWPAVIAGILLDEAFGSSLGKGNC